MLSPLVAPDGRVRRLGSLSRGCSGSGERPPEGEQHESRDGEGGGRERGQGEKDAESEEGRGGGGVHALGEREEEREEVLRGARMACGRLGVIVEVALRTEEVSKASKLSTSCFSYSVYLLYLRLGVIVEVTLRTEVVLSLLALLLRSSLLVALLDLLVQKYKY